MAVPTSAPLGATVGIVGAGSMGGAIARGLVQKGACAPADVTLCNHTAAKLEPFSEEGFATCTNAAELVAAKPDVVILAVKPQVLADVVEGLADGLADSLVVSIAAGVSNSTLEGLLPKSRVVRVMPNLPIQVLSGASAVAPGSCATQQDIQLVQALFGALGHAEVMREDQLDAEGAVVGCAPAYFALVVDALTRRGVEAGLPAAACRSMVEATMLGVARTLVQTGEHPRSYMEKVTSPGGTTAAALRSMEPGLVDAFNEGVDSALARTHELAGD